CAKHGQEAFGSVTYRMTRVRQPRRAVDRAIASSPRKKAHLVLKKVGIRAIQLCSNVAELVGRRKAAASRFPGKAEQTASVPILCDVVPADDVSIVATG